MLASAACGAIGVARAQTDIDLVEDVHVVARRVPTINFQKPGGVGVHLPLAGTGLAPGSRGQVDVDAKKGYVQLSSTIHGLPSAATFGDEYMTYVLWAITPEGRPTNLGEFLVESSRESQAHLEVTSELQAFGLVVTAEPHFSVTIPSDVVVMENGMPASGSSGVEVVDAEYQLVQRGTYSFRGESRTGLEVPSVPFYVVQARNARRIAIDSGGRQHAADTMAKGEIQLREAEADAGKSRMTSARQAAQTFEDARLFSMEASRQAREARSQLETDQARNETALALADLADSEQARIEAERRRAVSEAEKVALRARLRDQLQLIFETRDTARGLVVSMSNVLFAFNQAVLRPDAREKLSKLAGIVLSSPGLQLEIEGHADSIGSDEYNLDLSRRRASSVSDCLIDQAIPAGGMTSRGFGEAMPAATNATEAGRRLNRRVEIVLSGEAIGQSAFGG